MACPWIVYRSGPVQSPSQCALQLSLAVAKMSFLTSSQMIRRLERVSRVMVLYAPFHLLDATAAAGGIMAKALGKQLYGAAGNLVGYYGIGFPIGLSLMFAAKMGIFGLWTGLLICVFLQSVFPSSFNQAKLGEGHRGGTD
ncbi:hypothetical protein HF521_003015 [Silurus meridionalis]|uniref:Multidrug and toxin extrusion protein 1 n=1 Tax=Silurus meridionalis TaxID=175797 RepID=A0A8T0B1M2_SILME|nr:hypothetical protein HF521_003015 [Silurus meridionalis]